MVLFRMSNGEVIDRQGKCEIIFFLISDLSFLVNCYLILGCKMCFSCAQPLPLPPKLFFNILSMILWIKGLPKNLEELLHPPRVLSFPLTSCVGGTHEWGSQPLWVWSTTLPEQFLIWIFNYLRTWLQFFKFQESSNQNRCLLN